MADLYKILELSLSASQDDIKRAYKKLAKKYHPDSNNGTSTVKFREVSDAYEILSDLEKKKKYDSGIKVDVLPKTNRKQAKVIRREVFLPEEIGRRSPIKGFTIGKSYPIIQDMSNGNYLVVNDYGIAIVADPIYFVAAVPGLDKAFSPTEDGKIYYDGPIIPDSGKPLNRRK